MLRSVGQDVRYALRTWRQSPGVVLVVVASLAIGFGLNGTISTFTDAVLVRALPYRDPGRLVMAWSTNDANGWMRERVSYLDFADWTRASGVFEEAVAFSSRLVTLTGSGEPEMLQMYQVTPGLFRMLGVTPVTGRTFSADEEAPGRGSVAVLLHSLWQRRFAANPDAIGDTILLQGKPFTIIGVMPPGFHFFNRECEVIVPFTPELTAEARDVRFLRVMARLRPDLTLEQARARVDLVARQLQVAHPASNQGWRVRLVPVAEDATGSLRTPVLFLAIAGIFVLASALANVTNLALARATSRNTEMAIRMALGARRSRLFTQLLAEAALLAAAAVVLSAPLAQSGVQAMLALIPEQSSVSRFVLPLASVAVDGRIVLWLVAIAGGAALLLACVALAVVPRASLSAPLRESSRSGGMAASTRRGLSALVLVQMTAAVALSTAGALLANSFFQAARQDPGFRAGDVWTGSMSVPASRYGSPQMVGDFWRTTAQRLAELPGVRAVGAGHNLPLDGYYDSTDLEIEGRSGSAAEKPRTIDRIVAGDYFAAIGIPVRDGRAFTERDTLNSLRVAVIDEEAARRFWPNENPIGRRLRPAFAPEHWYEIVGVVGAVREDGLGLPPKPVVYFAHQQMPLRLMSLVIRSNLDPNALTTVVRRDIRARDPELALYHVTTMGTLVSDSIWALTLTVLVVAGLAVACSVLAWIGTYGIVSFLVARRTAELGLRLALGAQAWQLTWLILRQMAMLGAAAVGCGLLCAWLMLRVVSSAWPVELDPTSTGLMTASAIVMLSASLLAAYIPARRATRIDPLIAIRGA